MAFTYPPTGSTSSASGNDKTIQLITGAPDGWYSPKGFLQNSNRYWDKSNVLLTPICFSKDLTVSQWSIIVKEWATAGATFLANGGVVEAALYNSDANTFAPTTLNTSLGSQTIPGTDPAPGQQSVACIKTLASSVVLSANTVYYIAFRTAINNGSGGYVAGDGVEIQQLINTGTGLNPSMPVGENNLKWSNGEKAAIYDDANSSLAVGAWASSHAGLYPFVSWAAADMIHVNQGPAIHLKGSVA